MKNWLLKTAWPMVPPVPYSAFHVVFAVTGILCAVLLAWSLRGLNRRSYYRILFLCGLILALSELYKQLFIYYIVGQGRYDWWYFPFQLCSLPMYLCLLIPLFRGNAFGRILTTFVQDFGLLGGVMALLEPSGLLHPYWTLTLHGLSWHIMLVFISLFITFAQSTDADAAADGHASATPAPSRHISAPPETATATASSAHSLTAYLQMLPLFAIFCLIATAINTMTHGAADMFYISPYYPVTQVVFDKISILYGTGSGIFIYLLSICLGGFLCHMGLGFLHTLAQTSKTS